uniref:Uncharacterized protein n=1 Tax=Candidatus Kentrum sp. LPFa TaxID=2126335 RepID=A0A450XFE8_9GAMM|nr:MAG: hypothetical protein BECKLPF1236C_GA0070990_1005616 [Candidatus Kentron sp. LPFa]
MIRQWQLFDFILDRLKMPILVYQNGVFAFGQSGDATVGEIQAFDSGYLVDDFKLRPLRDDIFSN